MKKKLYLVGGTMGVGKSAACRILNESLDNSVFLDGDWCWNMHPFKVTERTVAMVLDNICHLLNSFIRCSEFDNIVFCWVMHEQHIIDEIISRLDASGCDVRSISLVCRESALRARLQKDVDARVRLPEVIGRSVSRIPLYEGLDTVKIDVSDISASQAARLIAEL